MLLQGFAEHQQVVKEEDYTLTIDRFEGGMYFAFESARCPNQPKGYYLVFELPEMGLESRIVLVTFCNLDLMVPRAQV